MNRADTNNSINLRSFSTDVLIFSIGQVLLLIFGFVQSLIIPKYLSTADYGYWQLFLLCTTYVGILHFGFLDGIHVQWAGKNIKDLREEIPTAFRFILLEQGIVVGSLILVTSFINIPSREIALAMLVNAVIVNLLAFFLFTAMATKNFKLLTATNIVKGLLFLILILFIFFAGNFSYISVILATMVTGLIIVSFFVFHFRDSLFHHSVRRRSLIQYGKENIGIGLFVLLGNFIALIFTTIDRVTVGSFFTITQFAVYAFAMTMCGLATVFLQAVAQVFFPYLSGSGSEIRTKAYSLLRPALVIFWAGMLGVYFPFSIWIKHYLPHYAESLPLMVILLCTVGFSGQINILHANFFKVYRKQRMYFVLSGIALLMAVILNLLAIFLFGTLTAVAASAVVSFSLWYLLNETVLRHLVNVSVREIAKWAIVICLYISAFLGAYAVAETWIIEFGIYVVLFAGITVIYLHKEMKQLRSIFKDIIKRKEDV